MNLECKVLYPAGMGMDHPFQTPSIKVRATSNRGVKKDLLDVSSKFVTVPVSEMVELMAPQE